MTEQKFKPETTTTTPVLSNPSGKNLEILPTIGMRRRSTARKLIRDQTNLHPPRINGVKDSEKKNGNYIK